MAARIWRAGLLTIASVLAGCVSTHNLQTDGANLLGGGYWDSEIKKGFYRIDAKSNFAMWPDYAGARLTWKFRAEKLCGGSEYEELQTREYDYESGPGFGGITQKTAAKDGYVLCRSSGLSAAAALALIKKP